MRLGETNCQNDLIWMMFIFTINSDLHFKVLAWKETRNRIEITKCDYLTKIRKLFVEKHNNLRMWNRNLCKCNMSKAITFISSLFAAFYMQILYYVFEIALRWNWKAWHSQRMRILEVILCNLQFQQTKKILRKQVGFLELTRLFRSIRSFESLKCPLPDKLKEIQK